MRRWLYALLAVAVVVIVVVGGLWLLGRAQSEEAEQPERAAARAGRGQPTAPAAGPTGVVGSGGAAASAWYQLYFTSPRYPDNPRDHQGGLDAHLVDLMNRAVKTLDVADYDFDLMDVADAMARAKQRGVRVRMVTDTDTLTNDDKAIQAAFGKLKAAGIPIVDDQRPAIMHDKFTVVDGEWVSTGSWNYTDGDTYHLNNNMIIIQSGELADNYTVEFERLFTARQFGTVKGRPVPHPVLTIGGSQVQNCFSPGGNCADLVVRAVNAAQRNLYFMAFSFTHDGIGQAMMARAKAGVTVQGVFETTGSRTQFSEYGKMKEAGLDVYTDGNPWVMHHKVIVIDGHLTVFGSFNFSANADDSNNENLLIIDNQEIARAFKTEFDAVLATAKNPPAKK